jgi:hypothetical protein
VETASVDEAMSVSDVSALGEPNHVADGSSSAQKGRRRRSSRRDFTWLIIQPEQSSRIRH